MSIFSSVSVLLRPLRLLALLVFASSVTYAQQAPGFYFYPVPVGQVSAPNTVTVVFSKPGQVASIVVGAEGASGFEFSGSGGSCLIGVSYSAGQSCTIMVQFRPSLPGERRGAVVLADASGAALATAYGSGVGFGALPTFSPGGPISVLSDVGDLGYVVDERETVFFGRSGDPATIYKHLQNGTVVKFATVPSQFASPYIHDIDGAGNLIVTSGNQLLRVDSAGHFTVVATIPPQPPTMTTISLESAAVTGDGTVYAGSMNGYELIILPDGSFTSHFETNKYGDIFPLDFVTVDSQDNIYFLTQGKLIETSLLTGEANSLAVDASGTLLLDNDSAADEPCPVPQVSSHCHPGDPKAQYVARVVGLADVRLSPNGDVYATVPNGTVKALYRLNRLEPRGIVIVSKGLSIRTAGFSLTNSGNQPLDLSQLELTLGGSSPDRFGIEKTDCRGNLAPGATCTTSLYFTPNPTYPFTSFATLELNGLPGQSIKTVQLIDYPN